jgi:GDPmannose 4,6-dehydratase
VEVLLGDASKARQKLGWAPSCTLEEMVAEMVEADLARHRGRSTAQPPTEASVARGSQTT